MCVRACVLITVLRADQNRYETVVRNTLRLARRPLAIQLLVQNWCVDRFDDGCRQVMAAFSFKPKTSGAGVTGSVLR